LNTLMVVSGGDAPGINAVLWHYARLIASGAGRMLVALGGLAGLLNGDIVPLDAAQIAPFADQPGAYPGTSRERLPEEAGVGQKLRAVLQKHGIDNVVLLGGDGTMCHVLPLLADWGIPCVGLPVSIDNDVPGTERTLGFDSACNYAYQAVDGLRATARALPGRIFLMETLGGKSGFLALDIALGAGACAALLPEYPYDDEWLADRLMQSIGESGHALVIFSEGITAARTLVDDVPVWTGIRAREVRLGHGQRGGKPSHLDRALAAQMARSAHYALRDGCMTGVVVVRDGRVALHEGTLDLFPSPAPDRQLYNLVNGLRG
jgi:6-phosphofructokinase 1